MRRRRGRHRAHARSGRAGRRGRRADDRARRGHRTRRVAGVARRRPRVHRPNPGGRAPTHRHPVAQGRLQPGLRVLHRSHQVEPAPRAAGLSAAPDDHQRRALCHAGAQVVRGEGADCVGAHRNQGARVVRCGARARRRADRATARHGACHRHRGRGECFGGCGCARGLRSTAPHRRICVAHHRRPAPGGRAHDAARQVRAQRRDADGGRARDHPHRPEHGRQVYHPAPSGPHRSHGARGQFRAGDRRRDRHCGSYLHARGRQRQPGARPVHVYGGNGRDERHSPDGVGAEPGAPR